jgi:30S ribosomal protein S31
MRRFRRHSELEMGKGDKRSRKGKLFKGSYGNTRKHKPKRAKPEPKR